MAFKLESVVPWGRNFDEYKTMFCLNEDDLSRKIAGFGDGPASFNYEAAKHRISVTSFDPIYCFAKEELQARIEEVRGIVMKQMAENKDNYIWTKIKSLDELENIRMSAMELFLKDYEQGKKEGRYIYHELPDKTDFEDNTFDIGLSSHFLLMYTELGFDFHIKAISEMLRICKEIRIFPVVDLDANKSRLTNRIIEYFDKNYKTELFKTDYEFQKGGDTMLSIKPKGRQIS